MHHFGCVVPSYEALETIKRITGSEREVIDMGSGNGYWTYMLRRQGVKVHPVDNLQSVWRTVWIGDTILKEGEKYLKEDLGGSQRKMDDMVLLLVYPIVGAEFTKRMIDAFRGRTIVVAGTQNRNGYTGFTGFTVEEFMCGQTGDEKDGSTQGRGWTKVLQIPLPSFAGKDEGLFVFERQPVQGGKVE